MTLPQLGELLVILSVLLLGGIGWTQHLIIRALLREVADTRHTVRRVCRRLGSHDDDIDLLRSVRLTADGLVIPASFEGGPLDGHAAEWPHLHTDLACEARTGAIYRRTGGRDRAGRITFRHRPASPFDQPKRPKKQSS